MIDKKEEKEREGKCLEENRRAGKKVADIEKV